MKECYPSSGRPLILKYAYKHSVSDTSSYTFDAIRATKQQQAIADSIINAEPPTGKIANALVAAVYTTAEWKIDLYKNKHYIYTLKDDVIMEGTWVQKGCYLILTNTANNKEYVAALTHNNLTPVYLPFLCNPEVFTLTSNTVKTLSK